jgi:hypothetical protein
VREDRPFQCNSPRQPRPIRKINEGAELAKDQVFPSIHVVATYFTWTLNAIMLMGFCS